MSKAIRSQCDPIRSLDYSLITGTYAAVGTALTHPARNVWLYNDTDKKIFFSFDGIHDNVMLPPLGYWFWDITANKTIDQGWFLSEGTKVYARALAANPTQNKVYFTAIIGVDL